MLYKKSLLFLLAVFFLSLNLAGAIQVQLSKESYNSGETLIARLDADFISSPSSDNVFFYRGHVLVNMIYDAVFSNNTLFIYAIVPDTARNYTIAVKNIKYLENGIVKETEIAKDFAVSSEKADFYVTPGLILTGGDFNIRAVSKKENYTSIKASFQGMKQDISLSPFGYKIISLSAKNIGSFSIIYLSLEGEKTSYSVPVLVYPAAQATADTSANETNAPAANISQGANAPASNYTNETNASSNASQESNLSGNASAQSEIQAYQAQEALKFNPDSITELSLIQEQLPLMLAISLMNLHTEAITGISLSYDKGLEGIISVAPGFIESIEPASSQNIELTLKKLAKEGFFNGSIYAKSGNFSAVFYLEINITKDYSTLGSLGLATEETCNIDYETLCQSSEFCANATQRYTAEGICCPKEGACKKLEEEKPKSSSNKIIGFVILFLVIIIALLLFLKFKKAKKKEFSDVYKKAEEKYAKEQRA
ncbi:hypothetical protein HYT26_04735 [Candidatus Pacearchaeota archaeon]|nr:hypothetical protein [Candidatus Pacearchaeota archaeon]